MAINLTNKYLDVIEKGFERESYIKNHCKAKIDFTNAKTVKVYMLKTTPVNDYKRSGVSRYGELKDIEDTVIEYTMTQDKSFTGVVDKGDESEQSIKNKAGQWLKEQLREQVVPLADEYALNKIANYGEIVTISHKPTKENIVGEIFKAKMYFDNNRVPLKGRAIFMKASMIPEIMFSKEWAFLDNLAGKQLPTGVIGKIAGFSIVEMPDCMFNENHYFTAFHESAVAFPYKINFTKIHSDPVGINGAVIEGRQLYDVFVLASKACAVYSLVNDVLKLPEPSIESSSKEAVSITCSGAEAIYYTLDGSDPRFSESRNIFTAPFDGTGKTLKAVGMHTQDKFTSSVVLEQIDDE